MVSEVETDLSQIRRDLEYYEEKIDPADGPAMSHSVMAVLYWRLGMRSKAFKALCFLFAFVSPDIVSANSTFASIL